MGLSSLGGRTSIEFLTRDLCDEPGSTGLNIISTAVIRIFSRQESRHCVSEIHLKKPGSKRRNPPTVMLAFEYLMHTSQNNVRSQVSDVDRDQPVKMLMFVVIAGVLSAVSVPPQVLLVFSCLFFSGLIVTGLHPFVICAYAFIK